MQHICFLLLLVLFIMRLLKAMLAKQFAKNKKKNNRRENNVVRVEWCRKTNRFASSQCPGDFYLESKEAQDDSGCVRGQIREADHLRFDVSDQFAADVSQVFTFLPATRPGMAKTSLHKKKNTVNKTVQRRKHRWIPVSCVVRSGRRISALKCPKCCRFVK